MEFILQAYCGVFLEKGDQPVTTMNNNKMYTFKRFGMGGIIMIHKLDNKILFEAGSEPC